MVTTGVNEAHKTEIVRLVIEGTQVAMLIAEESVRNKSQFVYHLKMARGQIRECIVMATICSKLDILNSEIGEYSRGQHCGLSKMIGALSVSVARIPVYHAGEEDDFSMPLEESQVGALINKSD